jgi:5-formyltetrahydrofolate cyclo-ligase
LYPKIFENLSNQSQKQFLRKNYLEKRKSLTNNALASMSEQICDSFFENFSISNYKNIHIFLPIQKQNEIDTWLIINKLQKDFPTINIIIPKANEDGSMENYLLNEKTILAENKWGIDEPLRNPKSQIRNQAIDLVLIPLIIFDKKGNRVGYGKGFYDRFLANCRVDVLKIGLSMFEPVDEIEDVNEFDIKLDFCITPNQIWTF